MFEQERWSRAAALPVLAGLAWLWNAGQLGPIGFVAATIPGALSLTSGVATWLHPGDVRIPQFAALGGILGALLGVVAIFAIGAGTGTLLVALSAASFLAAGTISVHQEPHVDDVPSPEPSLHLAWQVATDDALLSTLTLTLPRMSAHEVRRVASELTEAAEIFEARGWLDAPESFHPTPPPAEGIRLTARSDRSIDYEHLSFASDYAPDSAIPGIARWQRFTDNRTAHAWVVRGDDPSAPWLMCIHGFQLGHARIDLRVFEVERLRREGLNLILPVLPLHGPRTAGRRSGDGFLMGDVLQTVHAEAQAMWDLRRMLAWIRGQGGERIGVHGLSLGGYNTSLLASLDEDLACAIPGIPLADTTRAMWRHGPTQLLRYLQHHGIGTDEVARVSRVISPLALTPKVPIGHRAIYGGVADQLVPPDHVRDLWRHWGKPRIVWYQGAHVTFGSHPAVAALVRDTLRSSGLIAPAERAAA